MPSLERLVFAISTRCSYELQTSTSSINVVNGELMCECNASDEAVCDTYLRFVAFLLRERKFSDIVNLVYGSDDGPVVKIRDIAEPAIVPNWYNLAVQSFCTLPIGAYSFSVGLEEFDGFGLHVTSTKLIDQTLYTRWFGWCMTRDAYYQDEFVGGKRSPRCLDDVFGNTRVVVEKMIEYVRTHECM